VRGVTALACAACFAAGCYASHGRDVDAGPIDARPDEPDVDLELPSCDLPTTSWRRLEAEYPASWAFPRRARFGATTWVVGAASTEIEGGNPLQLTRFDAAAPPGVEAEGHLEGTLGGTIAAAADALRVATVATSSIGTFLSVSDPRGALLSRSELELETGRFAFVAVSGTRVGMVRELGTDATIAETWNVAGGGPISSTVLDGWVDASIGLGRGLFAFVARSRASGGGMSTLYGLDDMGTIPALELDPGFQQPSWDGATFAGLSGGGAAIRFLGGRIETRTLPPEPAFRDRVSVADGPHGAVLSIATDRRVYLSLPGSSEWIPIDAGDRASGAMADTALGRVGTFFVDGNAARGTLRWVGYGCAP
jgi:hypothetical protein